MTVKEWVAKNYVKLHTCVKCGDYTAEGRCNRCGQESSFEANLKAIEKESERNQT